MGNKLLTTESYSVMPGVSESSKSGTLIVLNLDSEKVQATFKQVSCFKQSSKDWKKLKVHGQIGSAHLEQFAFDQVAHGEGAKIYKVNGMIKKALMYIGPVSWDQNRHALLYLYSGGLLERIF